MLSPPSIFRWSIFYGANIIALQDLVDRESDRIPRRLSVRSTEIQLIGSTGKVQITKNNMNQTGVWAQSNKGIEAHNKKQVFYIENYYIVVIYVKWLNSL